MKDRKLAEIYVQLAKMHNLRATVQETIDAREEAGKEKYDAMGVRLMIAKVDLTRKIDDLLSELTKNL